MSELLYSGSELPPVPVLSPVSIGEEGGQEEISDHWQNINF